MSFKINCPHCGQKLEAEDEHVGKEFDCPACMRKIVACKKVEVNDKKTPKKKNKILLGCTIGCLTPLFLLIIIIIISLATSTPTASKHIKASLDDFRTIPILNNIPMEKSEYENRIYYSWKPVSICGSVDNYLQLRDNGKDGTIDTIYLSFTFFLEDMELPQMRIQNLESTVLCSKVMAIALGPKNNISTDNNFSHWILENMKEALSNKVLQEYEGLPISYSFIPLPGKGGARIGLVVIGDDAHQSKESLKNTMP